MLPKKHVQWLSDNQKTNKPSQYKLIEQMTKDRWVSVNFSPQWTTYQFCIVVMTNYRNDSHKYILIRAVALPRLPQSQEGILLCTQHNSLLSQKNLR